MFINNYMQFTRDGNSRSYFRYDLHYSTIGVNDFLVNDRNWIYIRPFKDTQKTLYGFPRSIASNGNGKYFATIYKPCLGKADYGFTFIKGSMDFYMFLYETTSVEILISNRMKPAANFLFSLFKEGKLNKEITKYRQQIAYHIK